MQQLRAGVIGLGHQALEEHIPNLLLSDRARLAAVCDIDTQKMAEYASQFSIPGYIDCHEMFTVENLDLVIVAVSHGAGRKVIEAAAKHHVHVLKEKPFAVNIAEAQALSKTCEEAGIELMVALQRRFDPIYRGFWQLADKIGTPFVVEIRYTAHVGDPSAGWRGKQVEAGGGCLIDMGYHMVDMILWYFGLPDRVLAEISTRGRPDSEYDTEDTALVSFGYEDGLYGSLFLSRCIGPKQEEVRLTGTKGIVRLKRGCVERLQPNGEIIETFFREGTSSTNTSCQIDHFCRVIEGTRENISGPRAHLAHAGFVEACYMSVDSQAYVNPKGLL